MALQDSISAASVSLSRAQATLNYIFDALSGPGPTGGESEKPYSSGLSGNAQNLADRMEQLENQLLGLRDILVTSTPIINSDIQQNQNLGVYAVGKHNLGNALNRQKIPY